jgi:hypothetical protein
MVVLPKPTIEKLGSPLVKVDSISIGVASNPFNEADFNVVILLIINPLFSNKEQYHKNFTCDKNMSNCNVKLKKLYISYIKKSKK